MQTIKPKELCSLLENSIRAGDFKKSRDLFFRIIENNFLINITHDSDSDDAEVLNQFKDEEKKKNKLKKEIKNKEDQKPYKRAKEEECSKKGPKNKEEKSKKYLKQKENSQKENFPLKEEEKLEDICQKKIRNVQDLFENHKKKNAEEKAEIAKKLKKWEVNKETEKESGDRHSKKALNRGDRKKKKSKDDSSSDDDKKRKNSKKEEEKQQKPSKKNPKTFSSSDSD